MMSFRLLPRFLFLCALGAGLLMFGGQGALATDDLAKDEARVFRIYLDADRTENLAAARSIEMGIRTALSHDHLLPDGIRFELVIKDHRGNAKRSLRNIKTYLKDEDGLAIIGGMHSPPYMTYREEINEEGALLLLPWSAAGSITRTDSPVNWIFRASVDDTKAGGFLVNEAVVKGGCKSPAMVLLNSGWGRFNQKQMTAALAELGITEPPSFYYDADISEARVRIMVRDLQRTNADCVLFVGNGKGSLMFVREMAQTTEGIRIFSHWGITGGQFAQQSEHADRMHLDMKFLQTCLPFGREDLPALQEAEAAAQALFPDEFTTLEGQPAPVGFAHAYDLGLILMTAMRETQLHGDIAEVRTRVRNQLEQLEAPVPGLLKTYQAPFSAEGVDAHEALGSDDLCLARHNEEGQIVFVDTDRGQTVGQ